MGHFEKYLIGKRRSKDWYKYLFDVAKTKVTGGNIKSAYRKYEIYCKMSNEPAFPLERLLVMFEKIANYWKEITEF